MMIKIKNLKIRAISLPSHTFLYRIREQRGNKRFLVKIVTSRILGSVSLFRLFKRPRARFKQQGHVLRCGQSDRADVELMIIVVRHIAEAAQ